VDHADAVTTGCLSPDERYFLWGGGRSAFKRPGDDSSPSGVLGLHETSTGRSLATWAGHEGAVTAVSATADGRHAFSAGTEGTIKAWDLTTTRCLRTFTGHSGAVTSLALSRDARYVLSAGVDRLVKVWLLDWRLLEDAGGAWDEGAEHYLKLFLSQHRPYGAALPRDQRGRVRALLDRSLGRSVALRLDPDELTRALTRRGPPVWTEEDFEDLLYLLGCAGYGGLSPEAVRQRLAEMARNGQERPSGPAE
jgi:WD40 repeat protein